jgi:hypothetical protein
MNDTTAMHAAHVQGRLTRRAILEHVNARIARERAVEEAPQEASGSCNGVVGGKTEYEHRNSAEEVGHHNQILAATSVADHAPCKSCCQLPQ